MSTQEYIDALKAIDDPFTRVQIEVRNETFAQMVNCNLPRKVVELYEKLHAKRIGAMVEIIDLKRQMQSSKLHLESITKLVEEEHEAKNKAKDEALEECRVELRDTKIERDVKSILIEKLEKRNKEVQNLYDDTIRELVRRRDDIDELKHQLDDLKSRKSINITP